MLNTAPRVTVEEGQAKAGVMMMVFDDVRGVELTTLASP